MEALENVFLTLGKVMECILAHDGGNNFRLPHMGKAKLRANDALPQSFSCDRRVYDHALAVLEQNDRSLLF